MNPNFEIKSKSKEAERALQVKTNDAVLKVTSDRLGSYYTTPTDVFNPEDLTKKMGESGDTEFISAFEKIIAENAERKKKLRALNQVQNQEERDIIARQIAGDQARGEKLITELSKKGVVSDEDAAQFRKILYGDITEEGT